MMLRSSAFLMLFLSLFGMGVSAQKSKSFLKLNRSDGEYVSFEPRVFHEKIQNGIMGAAIRIYEIKSGNKEHYSDPDKDNSLKYSGEVFTNEKFACIIRLDYDKKYLAVIRAPGFFSKSFQVFTYVPKLIRTARQGIVSAPINIPLDRASGNEVGMDPGNTTRLFFYNDSLSMFYPLERKHFDSTKVSGNKPERIDGSTGEKGLNKKETGETKSFKQIRAKVGLANDGTSFLTSGPDTLNRIDAELLRQGKWVFPDKNISGVYGDDKKEDDWKKFYPSDTLALELKYEDDIPTGVFKIYYENGKLRSKGIFVDSMDAFTGDYEYFFPDGTISKKFNYSELGLNSGTQLLYYPNGNMAAMAKMENGVFHGDVMLFLEDGTPSVKILFQHGKERSRKYLDPVRRLKRESEDTLLAAFTRKDAEVIQLLKGAYHEIEELDRQYQAILEERLKELDKAHLLISQQQRELILNKNKLSRAELMQKLAQEELSRQRLILFGGTFIVLILLSLSVIIWLSLRKQKQLTILIRQQKELVEEKSNEILSSITYAGRIQRSFLPDPELARKYLKEHFIFYKPRDIVSGDFYWMEKMPDALYIAVADCTGHGVPGALMSMLGSSLLRQLVKEKGLQRPGEILDEMRKSITEHLRQQGSSEDSKDGMDMVLVRLKQSDRNGITLESAGAKNPLWLYRKNSPEPEVIKGDRSPVGFSFSMEAFQTRQLQLNEGDTFYLFSDGYIDQFGGPSGKKYSSARLKGLFGRLKDMPLAEQQIHITAEFQSWKGDLEQTDDVLVMGIRI